MVGLKRYVINLDRSKDRLEHVSHMFEQQGLDFIRVTGVDGNKLSDEDFAHYTSVLEWKKKQTRGEVGCFLSHRECLKRIAEGDDAYGAIFEDDILLSPNSALFLKDWNWVPEGVDIVKIDTAKVRCLLGKFNTDLDKGYRLARLIGKHYCAGGYIISKKCAAHLYSILDIAIAPIDELYFNPECNILQTLNVQQMVPALVVQAGLISTIRSSEVSTEKRQSSKMPLIQKIIRESARFERKQFFPWRMKTFCGSFWDVVPFK